ncbi:MAG: hypothetical protein CVU57_04610 [Deltaproteobacteria bacterium HGW-Deltaproteobacteria-15]|nr:MAG: hypothetical protein CVU57_04610 [Deltaproteobacteria bacterium HGW-Deltaproteobacteria-15]
MGFFTQQNMDRSYHYTVYAGYHQFYLSRDEDSLVGSGAASFWTRETIRKLLATGPGLVGIGTGTYGDVPVSIHLAGGDPKDDLTGWDHVAETWIDLCSGRLHVIGCPDDPAGLIELEPGIYRVRVYSAKLDTIENQRGEDYYRIVMWSDAPCPPRVLKQWPTALTFECD